MGGPPGRPALQLGHRTRVGLHYGVAGRARGSLREIEGGRGGGDRGGGERQRGASYGDAHERRAHARVALEAGDGLVARGGARATVDAHVRHGC